MSWSSKAQATPGPWRVGEMCGGCINIEADTTPRHVTIGRVHVFGIAAEAEANARLIAEAPEMRKLLAVAQATAIENGPFQQAIRALLARIDGGNTQ